MKKKGFKNFISWLYFDNEDDKLKATTLAVVLLFILIALIQGA